MPIYYFWLQLLLTPVLLKNIAGGSFHDNPHFRKFLLPLDFFPVTWWMSKCFSTATIINFNILICISVEPQIWRMKLSAHEFCPVCLLHSLLNPKRSLISISIDLFFLVYLLWNTNWLFSTARLLFLLWLLGHLTGKCNSTNCSRVFFNKLFLPIALVSMSKVTGV